MELDDRSSRWGENFFNRHFVLNIGGGSKRRFSSDYGRTDRTNVIIIFSQTRLIKPDLLVYCNYDSLQPFGQGKKFASCRRSQAIVLPMHGFRKITDEQTGRFACGFHWQMRLIQADVSVRTSYCNIGVVVWEKMAFKVPRCSPTIASLGRTYERIGWFACDFHCQLSLIEAYLL